MDSSRLHAEWLSLIDVSGRFPSVVAVRAHHRPLPEIPNEIAGPTGAIRAWFADPQRRVFRVALTFLVPARLARKGR